MLTIIGPNVFGTCIDNKRRTRITPTKDFPVPGGPYIQEREIKMNLEPRSTYVISN